MEKTITRKQICTYIYLCPKCPFKLQSKGGNNYPSANTKCFNGKIRKKIRVRGT